MEAYEAHDDPAARGRAAHTLARALTNVERHPEAASVASRAAAELPPDLEDLRKALEACELMALFWDGGTAEQLSRLEPYRARPVGAGLGARMLAAVAAQEWVYWGGASDECAALALEALAGGELIEADNGFTPVMAIGALVLADRVEALEACERSLQEAHRRGSLFAKSNVSWAVGYALHRRGELAEAEEAAAARRSRSSSCGRAGRPSGTTTTSTASLSSPWYSSTAATWRQRAGRSSRRAIPATAPIRPASGSTPMSSSSSRRAGPRRRSPRWTSSRAASPTFVIPSTRPGDSTRRSRSSCSAAARRRSLWRWRT